MAGREERPESRDSIERRNVRSASLTISSVKQNYRLEPPPEGWKKMKDYFLKDSDKL